MVKECFRKKGYFLAWRHMVNAPNMPSKWRSMLNSHAPIGFDDISVIVYVWNLLSSSSTTTRIDYGISTKVGRCIT